MKFDKAAGPKCASAKVLKSRPHPSLLCVISKKWNHPGRGYRIRRWDRYKVGMSVLHCRETPGLDHLDIGFYEKHGLMTLRPMTPEERREALRRWDGNDLTRGDTADERIEAAERAPRVTREVNSMVHVPVTKTERDRAYLDAVDSGAWETAYQIAHLPEPSDATVEKRSAWGARRYRTRVEANKPDPRRHEGWDVCPTTGKKDSKTYEEWRAYYDKLRPKYPPFDVRKEWEILKLGFRIFVATPLTILGALGLFSGRRE